MSEAKLINSFDEEPDHNVVGLHVDSSTALPDISDMGVLSETLQLREPTIGDLYEESVSLLNHTGQETTVNDLPALVSHFSYPVRFGKQTLYARLGCKTDTDGNPAGLVSVIFCADDAMENIRTNNGYFSALSFDSTGSHIITGTGENPATDEAKPVALVKSLLADTKKRFATERRATQEKAAADATAAAKKQAAESARAKQEADEQARRERQEKQRQKENLKEVLGRVVAVAIGGGMLWYNSIHSAITGAPIDAKIGPVPMPAPIEWLVDWNNGSDHTAQGFKEPKGALPLQVGMAPTAIPLLTGYDTKNAPDASFNDGMNGYKYDESKPGLYNSDFNSDYKYDPGDRDDNSGSASFDKSGCYTIRGDYQDGRTVVFSQTVGINNLIRLSVPDTKTLEVCKAPDAPKHFKGSLYLDQKPEP